MTERYTPGTSIKDLTDTGFGKEVCQRLGYWEDLTFDMTDGKQTLLDMLHAGAERGISIRTTAKQVGVISPSTVSRIYRAAGILSLSQAEAVRANWQDPEFRRRHAEASRAMLSDRRQDPEFRRRHAEAVRAMLSDRWQDPEFRRRQAEAVRAMLSDRWQDPEFRRRHAEAVRANWQDPEFRRRRAEASRAARFNESNQGRYRLPTIQGVRKDVGYAHSAWEANIARILRAVGRDYITHQVLPLGDGPQMEIDFITLNKGGRYCLYEIMAHPLEDPQGWDRLNQAQEENPQVHITPITKRFYARLRRLFKDRINNDPQFCGWETEQDSLRSNPTKYS